MKKTWINRIVFDSCWSVMIWCFLMGMVLAFFVMGLVAIGILPKYFYGLSNLIGAVTGASIGGLLLFMIPLSIIWNKDKEARTVLIILSVVACVLNGIFQNNPKIFAIFMLIFIVSIVISCVTEKTKSKKHS